MRLALTSSSNEGRFFFVDYMQCKRINKVIGDIYLRAKVINNTLLHSKKLYLFDITYLHISFVLYIYIFKV